MTWPDQKKRICQQVDCAVPTSQRLKREKSEKLDKYLDLAWERESVGDINRCSCPWNSPQRSEKETGGTVDQRKNRNHPDHWRPKDYREIFRAVKKTLRVLVCHKDNENREEARI